MAVEELRAARVTGRMLRSLEEPLQPVFSEETLSKIRPAPWQIRVVLLSQYFPPEIGATQSRMQSFAEYLAARGHDVTVIAEFPNHPQGVTPERYDRRLIALDDSNGYRVIRVWVKTSPVKNQQTRLAFYASYTALATAVAPLVGGAEVVVATSPPLFAGIAGLALARTSGAAFVLDVRDLWPAAADALQQISGGWMGDAALRLERSLYRQATAVTAVTEPFCQHVDRIRGKAPATVHIPNGTLELFFEQGDPTGVRERLGVPEGKFLVTFAGTLGIAQALPAVLRAAKLAEDDLHFAFVGDGPVKQALVEEAAKLGVTNVTFAPQIPMSEMPGLFAASDALLVPLSGHPTFADFVPSKIIDFMASGKPVILSAAGEPARLLERAGGGIAVEPEDPEGLVAAARRLAADPALGQEFGRRGREFAAGRMRIKSAELLEQLLVEIAR
jgi:glycosyltransferase involved in cell wall biosynthesis